MLQFFQRLLLFFIPLISCFIKKSYRFEVLDMQKINSLNSNVRNVNKTEKGFFFNAFCKVTEKSPSS